MKDNPNLLELPVPSPLGPPPWSFPTSCHQTGIVWHPRFSIVCTSFGTWAVCLASTGRAVAGLSLDWCPKAGSWCQAPWTWSIFYLSLWSHPSLPWRSWQPAGMPEQLFLGLSLAWNPCSLPSGCGSVPARFHHSRRPYNMTHFPAWGTLRKSLS